MKIRDVMSIAVEFAHVDDSLEHLARMMRDSDVGAVPVIDHEDNLAGIITDRDIVVQCIADGKSAAQTKALQLIHGELWTVAPDDDVARASEMMHDHQVRRLPVVEDGELIGMVSLGDLAVKTKYQSRTQNALSGISQGVRDSEATDPSNARADSPSRTHAQRDAAFVAAGEATDLEFDDHNEDIGDSAFWESAEESNGTGRRRLDSAHVIAADGEDVSSDLRKQTTAQRGGSRSPLRTSTEGKQSTRSKSRTSEASPKRANPVTRSNAGAAERRGGGENAQGISSHREHEEDARQSKVVSIRGDATAAGRRTGSKSKSKKRAS